MSRTGNASAVLGAERPAGPRVAAAVLVLLTQGCAGACDAMVGPEASIRSSLLALQGGFDVVAPGGTAISIQRAQFREAQVFSDRDGNYVNALVDADGRSGEIAISYLGIENIRFARREGRWQPTPPVLGNLAGIASALRTQDSAAGLRPRKWAIRVDRGEAQVSEESQSAPDGASPQVGLRSYSLSFGSGSWRIKNGADARHLK